MTERLAIREQLDTIIAELRAIRASLERSVDQQFVEQISAAVERRILDDMTAAAQQSSSPPPDPVAATNSATSVAELKRMGLWKR